MLRSPTGGCLLEPLYGGCLPTSRPHAGVSRQAVHLFQPVLRHKEQPPPRSQGVAADRSPPICLQMAEAGASTKLPGGHRCLKRHGLGVGGTTQQTVLMEAPLKTTDARREEEGGQGRVCLSLCGCVGQCPTVSLGAPSHVFALMASVQAAFWPWKTALQPRLHAHSLTKAATPSHMHTAYTYTLIPHTPSHPCNAAPAHTCSSSPGLCTFTHMYTHTHPPLRKTRFGHTHLPHIHASLLTYLTSSYHTHTYILRTPWISLSHPCPISLVLSLSHTHHNRHLPPLIPVHMCACLSVHTCPLTSSQLFHNTQPTSQFICIQAQPRTFPRGLPPTEGPLPPNPASWVGHSEGPYQPRPYPRCHSPWEPRSPSPEKEPSLCSGITATVCVRLNCVLRPPSKACVCNEAQVHVH